jgi:RNA polymerase sigma-19 factor, ECF subfamily
MSTEHLFCHQQIQHLYSANKRWLSRWFERHLTCAYQAEDLTHNTFIRILQSKNSEHIQEPRAFLTTLAKRELFSFWRRRDIEQAYLLALYHQPESVVPSEEALLIIRNTLMEIDLLLDGLPAKVKKAFLLNRLEGLTYKKIAEEMGLSLATVERYMKQAFLHCYHAQGMTTHSQN